MKRMIAIVLTLLVCLSVVSMAVFADTTTYYLVGYINGADYGFEGDAANMGEYKFENGKLTVTFNQDSYVFLKTEGNASWFMTDAYVDGNTGTFKNTETGSNEKMRVPGNVAYTFTLVENADGTITLSYAEASDDDQPTTQPTTEPTATQPTTPTTQAPGGNRILNVKAPSSWSKVYVYTWDPEEYGTFPGSEIQKSGDVYKVSIKNSMANLIVTGEKADTSLQQTPNIALELNGKEVTVTVAEDGKATVTYDGQTTPPPSGKDPAPDPTTPLSSYRVVGNTDWLGNWDAASDKGRMHDMGNGVYRVNFDNVAPGSYQIKITKDGTWDVAYGTDDGQNFTFTVAEKCKITVDFTIKADGKHVIEVYGKGVPDTADISMLSVVVLMALASVTAVVLVVNKKKFI